MLTGNLDFISNQKIKGWCRDGGDAAYKPAIRILYNGEEISRCVADRERGDLREAFGDGFCSFDHGFPRITDVGKVKAEAIGKEGEIYEIPFNGRLEQYDYSAMAKEIQTIAEQDGVFGKIHARDMVFNYEFERNDNYIKNIRGYFARARESAQKTLELADKYGPKLREGKLYLMEFACGYGAVTRYLLTHKDKLEVSSFDIHPDAVKFINDEMGGAAYLSIDIPENLDCDAKFDVICAHSFFSHMPIITWQRWLGKLAGLLKPDGILIFSTHGEVAARLHKVKRMPRSGYIFLPFSEQTDLATVNYGTCYTNFEFVFDNIKLIDNVELIKYETAYWWNYQDLYILKKNNLNFQDITPDNTIYFVERELAHKQPYWQINRTSNHDPFPIGIFKENLDQALAYANSLGIKDIYLLDMEEADKPGSAHILDTNIHIHGKADLNRLEGGISIYTKPELLHLYQHGLEEAFAILEQSGITRDYYLEEAATQASMLEPPEPDFITRNNEKICEITPYIGDTASLDIFLRTILFRQTGEPGYLALSPYTQYEHPLVKAQNGDTVIEGGIDNAMSTLAFATIVGQNGKIFAFEPRADAAENIRHALRQTNNVKLENMGLWSKKMQSKLIVNGGASCVVSDSANIPQAIEITLADIDSYVAERDIYYSLLKIDIEGSEMECLKGAINSIIKFKPKLQICVYHKAQDIIDIPIFLLENAPYYTFYFGHHTRWRTETVLYAMPERNNI